AEIPGAPEGVQAETFRLETSQERVRFEGGRRYGRLTGLLGVAISGAAPKLGDRLRPSRVAGLPAQAGKLAEAGRLGAGRRIGRRRLREIERLVRPHQRVGGDQRG